MKDFIISTLDALLTISIILATLGGFLLLGNLNPFGGFSFGMALLGAALGFFGSVIFCGGIFTLIRIKELLEDQIFLMKSQQSQQNSRQPLAAVEATPAAATPAAATFARRTPVATIATPTGSSLQRCRKCNAILNANSTSCAACGAITV